MVMDEETRKAREERMQKELDAALTDEDKVRIKLYWEQKQTAAEITPLSAGEIIAKIDKAGKHFEIRSRAATDIQYARVRDLQIATNALEKAFNNPAPADKPPMRLLDLIHDRVGVLLHLSRQRVGYCMSSSHLNS